MVEVAQVRKGATLLRWTAGALDLGDGGLPKQDSLTAKDRRPFRWRL